MRTRLTYVLNIFGDGAVPNILIDVAPHIMRQGFDIDVVSLQSIPVEATCALRAKAIGLNVISLECGSREIARQFSRLRAYFRDRRPDIVHSHLGRSDILSALTVPTGIPLVTTLHNVRSNFVALTILGYRLTDGRIAARTCVSRTVQESWYRDWKLTSRNAVIYNPVDPARLTIRTERDALRESISVPQDARLLLNAGRLIPMKGQADLIAALPAVRERLPGTLLAIAGKGPLDEKLRRTARDLGVEDVVRFLGFRTDVPDLIHASDVVVFPSHWEGLGLVPIEAMFLQRPVIASAIGPIMEYITDGVEGTLIPPGDIEQLAAAIVVTLEGEGALDSQLRAARERATKMFSPESIAHQYTSLYHELGYS